MIVIEKPDELADKVLPLVYRQSRFASFSRQLNVSELFSPRRPSAYTGLDLRIHAKGQLETRRQGDLRSRREYLV